jgi:hypothetical protein
MIHEQFLRLHTSLGAAVDGVTPIRRKSTARKRAPRLLVPHPFRCVACPKHDSRARGGRFLPSRTRPNVSPHSMAVQRASFERMRLAVSFHRCQAIAIASRDSCQSSLPRTKRRRRDEWPRSSPIVHQIARPRTGTFTAQWPASA